MIHRATAPAQSAPSRLLSGFVGLLIKLYKVSISPLLGPHCRFAPSCSQYASEALSQHGIWRGSVLTMRRVARCHPWHDGGWDPVP